jgi:hypothetical protein
MPSSVIKAWHYDAATRDLVIVFQSARRYVYKNVPAEIRDGMRLAFSKGDYFNSHVRGRFDFERDDPAARGRNDPSG